MDTDTDIVVDVVIIGAGIVGSTMALLLARSATKYRIILIDTKPLQPQYDASDICRDATSTERDCRTSTINHASQRLFADAGIWPDLLPYACPYKAMEVWDGQNGARLDFQACDSGRDYLGYNISNHAMLTHLHRALAEEIQRTQTIAFVQISQIDAIDHLHDSSRIRLTNAEQQPIRYHCKLILAADGKDSMARAYMGIKTIRQPVKQMAVTSLVHCTQQHGHTARQIFLQHGPIALLPLPQTQDYALIWSTSPEQAQALMQLDQQTFHQKVSSYFRHKTGTVDHSQARSAYPLTSSRADVYIGTHFALLGDAAHSIHPLAGLGLNLGLADVSAMLTAMNRHGLIPQAVPEVLQDYQRAQRDMNQCYLLACDLLNKLFQQKQWYSSFFRKAGIQALQQFMPMKRQFIALATDPKATPLTDIAIQYSHKITAVTGWTRKILQRVH